MMLKVHFHSFCPVICYILVLSLFLSSCTYPKNDCQEQPANINREELLNLISQMQCDDGSFADLSLLEAMDRDDLYYTYCSLASLDCCGISLKDQDHSRDFFDQIVLDDLFIYDEFENFFFYLMSAHYLNYQIPSDNFARITDYISSLQTKDGCFAPFSTPPENVQGDADFSNIFQSSYFIAAKYMIELLHVYPIDVDLSAFYSYLQESLLHVDDTMRVSIISMMIQTQQLLPSEELNLVAIEEVYDHTLEILPQMEINIGTLYDLTVIGTALGKNNSDLLHSYLERFRHENGFYLFPDTESPPLFANTDTKGYDIMATLNGLRAMNKLGMQDTSEQTTIPEQILSYQLYDGRFYVGWQNTAEEIHLYSTYKVVQLLNELDSLDIYKEDLIRFYNRQRNLYPLDQYTVPDLFYLLSIGLFCDAPICEEDILSFQERFSEYLFETNKKLDYQWNKLSWKAPIFGKFPVPAKQKNVCFNRQNENIQMNPWENLQRFIIAMQEIVLLVWNILSTMKP